MDALEKIRGKTLEKTLYHEWVSDDLLTVDWIELVFSDDSKICFAFGGMEETMEIRSTFDSEKEKIELYTLFEGKVTIRTQDHSTARKWKNFIGQKITGYEIEETDEGRIRSVAISFGSKKLQIAGAEDSLYMQVLSGENRPE